MPSFVEQVTDLTELFGDVATVDPASGFLLAAGIVVFAFSLGVVGALSIGALVETILYPFE